MMNLTFLIPTRIETEDRLRNIIASVSYLLRHVPAKVIVKEVSERNTFLHRALPEIKKYADTDNLTHLYEENNDPLFCKSKVLNDLIVAAKTKDVSYFRNLGKLNQKESPRLKWAEKILRNLGVKTITTNESIKIYGNPNLNLNFNKKIKIKNYLKDHRVFMTSLIAALSFGGKWTIHDKDSINTSFPNFLKIINDLKK